MSKQLLQMDNTMCHHPLIQGPQKGHGCSKSLCRSLPLNHKPPSGVRGDFWNITYFFKKCVLPCILQDSLQKCERSLAQLGTSENPVWEKRWSFAKAAGLFFAQGYCAKRRDCIKTTSCTATLFHKHFEPSYPTIDVTINSFLFFSLEWTVF